MKAIFNFDILLNQQFVQDYMFAASLAKTNPLCELIPKTVGSLIGPSAALRYLWVLSKVLKIITQFMIVSNKLDQH